MIYGQSFTRIRGGKQSINGFSSRILEPLRRKAFGTGDTVRVISEALKSYVLRSPGARICICLRSIAFRSCAIALSTETAPWYQDNAPSLSGTIGSVFLSVGLIMIVSSGADFFTINVMAE